jgi:hypothetical protein
VAGQLFLNRTGALLLRGGALALAGNFTPASAADPPVSGGGDGTLLETVSLVNFTGASRTSPKVTFARYFEEGAVPSGSRVSLEVGSAVVATQQVDQISRHSDNSLKRVTFTAILAGVSAATGAIVSADLRVASGAISNPTVITKATLTAANYRVEAVISGTTYFCLLNNCETSGNVTRIRNGSAMAAWKHWGVLRAGSGVTDADQGQLQARFFSYVWADGTTVVLPEVINGRVGDGQSYGVTSIALKDRATSAVAYGTPFVFYAHTGVALCKPDGNPWWSSAATDFHANVSYNYLDAKKLTWYVSSTPTQRSAIGSGAETSYVPMTLGEIGSAGIDSAGGNSWIGLLPQWSHEALLSNNKSRLRNDRINAFSQFSKFSAWFVNESTGFPPVVNNTTYSALSTPQPSIGWGSGNTITDSGGTPEGAATNQSHGPEYAYSQWITTGWEWWHEHQVQLVAGTVGAVNPGNDTYQRNAIINGTQYRGCLFTPEQCRAIAWSMRSMDNCDWTAPDEYRTTQYIRDMLTSNLDYCSAQMTPSYWTAATMSALGIWETGEGVAAGITYGSWMHGYLALNVGMVQNRGRITASHPMISKHLTRWWIAALNACPYHVMGADRISFKAGSAVVSVDAAYAQTFDDVYHGGDGVGLQTIKIISNSAGVSGACPVAGNYVSAGEQYATGHSYPSIYHAGMEVANRLGWTGASAAITPLRAREALVAASALSWINQNPGWNIRRP